MQHLDLVLLYLLGLSLRARQRPVRLLVAHPAADEVAAGAVELRVLVERRALRAEVTRRTSMHVVEPRRLDLRVLLQLGQRAQLPGVDVRGELLQRKGRLALVAHEALDAGIALLGFGAHVAADADSAVGVAAGAVARYHGLGLALGAAAAVAVQNKLAGFHGARRIGRQTMCIHLLANPSAARSSYHKFHCYL